MLENSMDKKYQIFISSTYTDLIEERKKVQETILSMYHIPIGMEMFSADDDEQWEIIKDTIDTSDYYVLIVGHRYGSLTKEGISYTRKEYEYASSQNIPVLAFIISPEVAVLPQNMDTNPDMIEKLNQFIDLIKKKPVEWWTNKDDLATKVSVALTKQFSKKKRPGWIRADKFNIEETQEELLQLLKRNRELEEENKEWRAKSVQRQPKLGVTLLPAKGHQVFSLPKEERSAIQREVDYEYSKIENNVLTKEQLEDADLMKQVEEYNNSLPDDKTLKKYIRDQEKYCASTEYGNKFIIRLWNSGTCKANNVSVKITYPGDVIITETYQIGGLKRPEAPKKLKNPVHYEWKGFTSSFLNLSFAREPSRLSPISLGTLHPNYGFRIEKSSMELWCDTLMHKNKKVYDECSISAVKPGTYTLQCEFICEEYPEPESCELKIQFVEADTKSGEETR